MDLYDKLAIEISYKPSFNGFEAKEGKKTLTAEVGEVSNRRIVIPPSNPHPGTGIPDPCQDAPEAADVLPTGAGISVVFVSLKLSPSNAKGISAPLIGKEEFKPQHDAGSKAVKLETDAVSFYTTGDPGVNTAIGAGVPSKLWIFNPNKKPIAIDVKCGISPKPPGASPAPASPPPAP